jgi:hypothetical protein
MLDTLPWRAIRRGIAAIRRRYYTVPWPENAPSITVTLSPALLERRLRQHEGFEGSPYSYRYAGEVVNLRRPWGVDPDGQPRELHIRARRHPDRDGLEVVAHVEPSRYEAKQAHIDGHDVDWQAGIGATKEILPGAIAE